MPPPSLILGGGLAGSALATLLARAGRPVTLVEQHAQPHHKVCGEFLSHEALHYLTHLGLYPSTLGAVPLTHLRFAAGRTLARVALPFAAQSLTRRTLDEALLALAADAGVEVLRGHRIEHLDLLPTSLWQATLAGGVNLRASHVFLATGKHDLRHHPRPPGRQNSLIAFKQYFHLTAPQAAELASHVELHLFPGGYAGLQPVEPDLPSPLNPQVPRLPTKEPESSSDPAIRVPHVPAKGHGFPEPPNSPSPGAPCPPQGTWVPKASRPPLPSSRPPRANLCLLLERSTFRRLGATWAALLDHLHRHAPLLSRRLEGATPLLDKPLALSNIPYGHLRRHPEPTEPNLWRIGDQTAVIPSFSGDGMSIALHTASLAASLFLLGLTPADLAAQTHQALQRQIGLATRLSQTLVSPRAQPLIHLVARLTPGLLPRLASATRIPTLL